MFGLEDTLLISLLIFSLLCACFFEFVNGFHDTANAVATVIYTNSLKPWVAVVWSAIWNFTGVMIGGTTVAMSIVYLLPVELLIDQSISSSMAMVIALLFSAIIWNFGTWYFGLPASSSHTLIGSILGVGIAYGMLPNTTDTAVNWGKVNDIGLSLLLSPLFGCTLTIVLMYILRKAAKKQKDVLFDAPKGDRPPPLWIRTILILTSTGVSYAHGNNDGQKGVGLMMLILIGIVPSYFALDRDADPSKMKTHLVKIESYYQTINTSKLSDEDSLKVIKTLGYIEDIKITTDTLTSITYLGDKKPFELRKDILMVSKNTDKFLSAGVFEIPEQEKSKLVAELEIVKKYTDYAPDWIKIIIAISLGLGTMIGWKRIVVTLGEKIGKQHLTYAQGASAELVAASTIGVSSFLGLPVSTTHVLSSGIAGSMIADKGIKNLQGGTVRNILLAWLLTLPVTIILSGGLYLLLRQIL
ncbi:MAG: inorganic phosphate transporter [Bacteroidota bacterium]